MLGRYTGATNSHSTTRVNIKDQAIRGNAGNRIEKVCKSAWLRPADRRVAVADRCHFIRTIFLTAEYFKVPEDSTLISQKYTPPGRPTASSWIS